MLLFEFESVAEVKKFLLCFYHFSNKTLANGKINTIFIWGQSNSGKNFFFDSCCELFINYGKMTNPSRQNNFSWIEAQNRRVIIWNEAKLDPAFEEDVLTIFWVIFQFNG